MSLASRISLNSKLEELVGHLYMASSMLLQGLV